MFKNIISPVQAWLLSQGKCVGCGSPLSRGVKVGRKITCRCRRIYVLDESGKYRRAKLEET